MSIVLTDNGLFDHSGCRFVDPGFDHLILKALDQLIADLPLTLGTADLQRSQSKIGDLFRNFGFLQQKTDLRTVAVADHHIPAFFDHFHDMACGLIRGKILALHRLVSLIFDQ